MSEQSERDLASFLLDILKGMAGTPAMKRMRLRLRDLGTNVKDEVAQARVLQKACRESPELALALDRAGFTAIELADLRRPDIATGELIQAFNRLVEEHWEEL